MKYCKIIGCDRKSTRKLMCEMHYRRKRIWGHTGTSKPIREHHGMFNTPVYRAWAHMITRCYNKKTRDYKNYGGRGIEVCGKWRDSFTSFYNDMGDKPSNEHSLDRINNEGNYEPSNCRWATRSMQNRNQRPKKRTNGLPTGVYKVHNRYRSTVTHNYKSHYLGSFETVQEAENAYLTLKDQYQKHHSKA